MQHPHSSTSTMLSVATLLLLSPSVAAVLFDCNDVVVDGMRYDFHELGGPRSVHHIEDQPPAVLNTTFTVDICNTLNPIKGVDPKDQCPTGTRVCGVTTSYNPADNTSTITKVVPVAGNYASSSGGHLDPRWTRLKSSDSNADADSEGLRLELRGGKYPFSSGKGGVKQKALIEFICDRNRTGIEGTEFSSSDAESRERKITMERSARKPRISGHDEGDEENDNDDRQEDDTSLRFVGYKMEDEMDVLRLSWHTQYACENESHGGSSVGKSEHWGLFTWFIIIVFLCSAAYLIFGSWLNYERYGARGWDAIPHGDAIRDVPYLIKDFGRRVANSLQDGGRSRGGYSAV